MTTDAFLIDGIHAGDMLFGNKEHVHGGLRANIMKSKNVAGFKRHIAWDFFFNNLTKQASQRLSRLRRGRGFLFFF